MSSPTTSHFETAVMIRRILFFLFLISFTLLNLFPLFRGLDTPQAMEQAAIAREIARGEGFVTKMVRPLAYYEAQKTNNGGRVPFTNFRDTYHAPLNPLILGAVLKLVGADEPGAWPMTNNEYIFPLDRIVALVSTLFFLMSIGVTYLLVGRIFDPKIAGVTALLMLLCDLMWQFSQSGLPQMLLLLLFSCGLYFTYRAMEAAEEGRSSFGMALLGGAFFVLMALAHWIAIWIFLGYAIFVAVAFKPRGAIALAGLGMLAIAIIFPLIRSNDITGQPFGTGFYVFYNGLAGGAESVVMRNHDLQSEPLRLDGLIVKVLGTTLVQASDLLPFLGGILAAPIFFLALLHPFKRRTIASFRWGILLMWAFAALGMAVFGIDRERSTNPNQIHILFAPVMAAYGLAFISILWSRLDVVANVPFLRNAHFITIIVLSAAPMLLTTPNKVRLTMQFSKNGFPWPHYRADVLSKSLPELMKVRRGGGTEAAKVVVSDQPWAVAWYADTVCVWLPKNKKGFDKMEADAEALGTPFAGILTTPSSIEAGTPGLVQGQYSDLSSLVFNGYIYSLTYGGPQNPVYNIMQLDSKTQGLWARYGSMTRLVGGDFVWYGSRNTAQEESSR
ncbi:ArnT family glycosyltransferase [Luteolibacter sp. Populi]|uniref:ArnT family glycosyltransferase n=1 Tax=Luteolibacter sp. Populi TaxID=3230487 RepID=UPI00346723B9